MPAELKIAPLPPQEAIDYFRAKGLRPAFAWQDVWQEEHAKGFTVAKAMDRELLEDIRQAVDSAIANGTTLEQFRAELTPTLQAKGWWGRQKMEDPATGKERTVQLGSPRRLKTIYETNLRTAYGAGRWQRMQAAKAALPYLVYHHMPGEPHPRPEHEAWDETTLPIDDPWWKTHYTPNGWGCNCWVTQASKKMLGDMGLEVTAQPVKFPQKVYTNPRTGEVSRVEQGIDPGWSYNVGEAPMEGVAPKPSPLGVQPDLDLGPGARLRKLDPQSGPTLLDHDVSAKEAEAAFLGLLDLGPGETVAGVDHGGEGQVLGAALFQGSDGRAVEMTQEKLRQLPLAARALKAPQEIWWTWRAGELGSKRQLVRRYIARLHAGDAQIGVAVDMAPAGGAPSWAFATSLDHGFDLDRLRGGILAWRDQPPTEAELEAVAHYTGSGFAEINEALREGEIPAELEPTIAALDALLGRQLLRRGRAVYRGIDIPLLEEIEEGVIIEDPAFLSTSGDLHVARRFAGDGDHAIVVEILAPAEARGMDVAHLSEHPAELETLFARGARLRVLSWNPDERILTVEIVL